MTPQVTSGERNQNAATEKPAAADADQPQPVQRRSWQVYVSALLLGAWVCFLLFTAISG